MTDSHPRPDAQLVDEVFDRWLPGAMFPSELFWLVERVRAAGIDTLIECGRQDGVSTWTLAQLLPGTDILSIDFDDDRERFERVRRDLEGLRVTCVSGDIHARVPQLLRASESRAVAVVQDGPKGWEGMGTLIAAGFDPKVRLIAQHNLHLGHRSRTAFQMYAMAPCFLEDAQPGDEFYSELRRREMSELPEKAPNRAIDHTSLGLMDVDGTQRDHLIRAASLLRRVTTPWDPIRIAKMWAAGDDDHVSRVRKRARYTRTRFQRR